MWQPHASSLESLPLGLGVIEPGQRQLIKGRRSWSECLQCWLHKPLNEEQLCVRHAHLVLVAEIADRDASLSLTGTLSTQESIQHTP